MINKKTIKKNKLKGFKIIPILNKNILVFIYFVLFKMIEIPKIEIEKLKRSAYIL